MHTSAGSSAAIADEIGTSGGSDDRLRVIFDALPATVSYVDADCRYRLVNETYRQWFGRPTDDLLGRHVREVLGEAAWETVRPLMLRALAGEEVTYEQELPFRDGGPRTVQVTYTPDRDGAKVRGLIVFANDVTERRQQEDALREQKERLRAALAASSTGTFRWVFATGELTWDESLHALLGRRPGRASGSVEDFLEAVHPEDRATVADAFHRCKGGEDFDLEFRAVHADGTVRWLYDRGRTFVGADGRPAGVTGACADVTARRSAEAGRRASERHLSDLLSSIDALFMTVDRRWRVTHASRPLVAAARHHRADIIGAEIWAVYPESVGTPLEAAFRWAMTAREPAQLEVQGRRTGRWLDTSVYPTSEGISVFARDVTERRLAERQVADARAQLQLVMDVLPVAVSRTGVDRRFVWVNHAYAARHGLSPDEVAGRPMRDILGDAVVAVLEPHIEAVLQGQPVEFEFEAVYRAVGTRWMHCLYAPTLDAAGKADGWVAVITDTTERHELERALRASEVRHRSLSQAISSIVWSADAQGCLHEPLPAWEEYTGQAFEQYRGQGWLEALAPDDRRQLAGVWRAAAVARAPYFGSARLWHAPTGRHRYCETRGVPILAPDGTVREWIGTVVDVDDRERAVEELKAAARRKDEFLAMLSHELRNPLAPMLTAVEVLERKTGGGPFVARQHEVIARQVQHMKRLLDDLLDVARVSQGKIELRKESVGLREILTQAVEVSRPVIASKGHVLSVSVGEGLQVHADPTRLTQVFTNLLNNAAKYTERGGRIELEARRDGEEALVRIRDNGIGMSADLIERAFELFTQADRSLDRTLGGLGIGLTLVRSLVQMHGGSVRAHSDGPGRGSELVVRLPLTGSAPAPGAAPSPPGAIPAQTTLRILVVDDNADAAAALRLLLELSGHEVSVAYDGPSAVERAAAVRPELVLLDIGLPGMSGYEVAREIAALGHDTVLVALTGYGRDEDRQRSREAGCHHHLVKPASYEALEEVLEDTVRRRLHPAD